MIHGNGAALTVGSDTTPVANWDYEAGPIEYVQSIAAMLPDPDWSATDSQGHVHQWARTGREAMGDDDSLPTLTPSQRDVPCDGSCGGLCGDEGYSITVYHCVTCGDEIRPGFIPDHEARSVGTPIKAGPDRLLLTLSRLPQSLADNELHPAEFAERGGKVVYTGSSVYSSEGEEHQVVFYPFPAASADR